MKKAIALRHIHFEDLGPLHAEFASRGYLRASVASPTSSLTVFRWLTTDRAKRGPDLSL